MRLSKSRPKLNLDRWSKWLHCIVAINVLMLSFGLNSINRPSLVMHLTLNIKLFSDLPSTLGHVASDIFSTDQRTVQRLRIQPAIPRSQVWNFQSIFKDKEKTLKETEIYSFLCKDLTTAQMHSCDQF